VSVVSELDRSFNTCPTVERAYDVLPSERQLEPFTRALFYRAIIDPYRAYADAVGRLDIRDATLARAKEATRRVADYLSLFGNASGSYCGALRAWARVGFDRPFDLARYGHYAATAFAEGPTPPDDVRDARRQLDSVEARMRELGVTTASARRFLVASDPTL
jgi:hypothetical protein